MSSKGSIDIEVELIGCEGARGASSLMAAASRFAGPRPGWRASRRGDEVALELSSDDAGYLEDEMARLGEELSGLAVPPEGWIARVSYASCEHDGDGGMVWLVVAGGKIARYEESVTTFVGKEPPFPFEVRREPSGGPVQVTVEKTLSRALDVPAGDFDGACDWVARNWEDIDFGEGTAFSIGVLDGAGPRERIVAEGVE